MIVNKNHPCKDDLKLVVLIPAFNEEKTIGNVVENLPRSINGISNVLVLVVDDGSNDSTVVEAKQNGADYVVSHAVNQGVGSAFKTGIETALELGADIVVNLDADGQHDPEDISRLIEPILNEGYDVVVGSRFIDASKLDMPFAKRLGNRLFTKAVAWTTGIQLTDAQSGFRAFSRNALMRLNVFGKFTYTQETLIEFASKGQLIKEIPVTVKKRNGKSKVVKSCYSYGLKALPIMLRCIRDNKPFAFFGTLGFVSLVLGFVTGSFMFVRWLLTGFTSPYASLIDFTVLSSLFGLFLLVLALLADMQGRQRQIQEETLFHIKSLHYHQISNQNSIDPLKFLEQLSTEELITINQRLDKES